MTEPEPPILTVIILNWNGAQFLPRCLRSLREQTLRNFHIVLVDNSSTDESVALTRRDFPEVEIVELGENLGYAEANNRAAAHSRAKYLLFLNNDTHLDPNALAALVDAAESRPHEPILAPQQRTYDGTEFLHVGLGMDVLGWPDVRGSGCRDKVLYSDGAALFIRRDVFCKLGGFDPHYFIFFEDNDLCWRAWLQGYRVGMVPQAVVCHKAGGTLGSSLVDGNSYKTTRYKRRLTHRNQLVTLLKNYSTPALFVVLPLFAAVTAAEVLMLLASGQGAAVREAYVPAWLDVLRDRSYIRSMRRAVQDSRMVSDWAIVRRMGWKLAPLRLFFLVGVPKVA